MGNIREKFRIPRQRIIDTAPIAGICILLSFARDRRELVMAAAIAILQVWLWMRHPRSRSRYFIAIGVAAVYGLLSLGPSTLVYGLDDQRLIAYLGVLAGSGIVPIVYRMLSRQSFRLIDADSDNQQAQTHGSILDIMCLSLFCAVLFIVLKTFVQQGWYYGLEFAVVCLSPVFSLAAIVSLILVSGRQPGTFARIVVAFVASMVVVVLGGMSVSFVAEWSEIERDPFGSLNGDKVVRVVLVFPIFAKIMQMCGVRLVGPTAAKQTDAVGGKRSKIGTVFRWLGIVFSFLLVYGVVAIVCNIPVQDYNSKSAGWPLVYGFEIDRESSSFSLTRLVINLCVCAIIAIAVCVRKPPLARLSGKAWRFARIGVLVTTIATIAFTSIIYPKYLRHKKSQLVATGQVHLVGEYNSERSFVDAGWYLIKRWWQDSNRVDSSPNAREIFFRDASAEDIKSAVALFPAIEVRAEDCDLRGDTLASLMGSTVIQSIGLNNCQIDERTQDVIASCPNLERLELTATTDQTTLISSLQQQTSVALRLAVTDDTVLNVPDSIRSLTIKTSNQHDLSISVLGGKNLQQLSVESLRPRKATGTTTLRIADAPTMSECMIHWLIDADLTVDNVPYLANLEADVSRLVASDLVHLDTLILGVGNCQSMDLGKLRIKDKLVISGRAISQQQTINVVDAHKFFSELSSSYTSHVTVRNCDIDSSVAAVMFKNLNAEKIRFLDSKIAPGAFDNVQPTPMLDEFIATDYQPDDDQLARFATRCPNLSKLHINGSNLTKLPQQFAGLWRLVLENAIQLESFSAAIFSNAETLILTDDRHPLSDIPRRPWLTGGDIFPHYRDRWYLAGRAANDATINAMKQRFSKPNAACLTSKISIVSPTASHATLKGMRLNEIEELHFENADKITKSVFESWTAPNIREITFVGSGVWPETLQSIQSTCPAVNRIHLIGIDAQLVKCTPFKQLGLLIVEESKIDAGVVDVLASARSSEVVLRKCEMDAETKDYVSGWNVDRGENESLINHTNE